AMFESNAATIRALPSFMQAELDAFGLPPLPEQAPGDDRQERAGPESSVAQPGPARAALAERDEKWWSGDRRLAFTGKRQADLYMVRRLINEARDTAELGSLRGTENAALIDALSKPDREDVWSLWNQRAQKLAK